jgi:hypothetical protein
MITLISFLIWYPMQLMIVLTVIGLSLAGKFDVQPQGTCWSFIRAKIPARMKFILKDFIKNISMKERNSLWFFVILT